MRSKSNNKQLMVPHRQAGSISSRRAFTLIELLVAISLMLLIMGVVATIFSQSSMIYTDGTARMVIYNTALVACSSLANDLQSGLPLVNNMQSFTLGENAPEEDIEAAQDYISFKAAVSIQGEVKTAAITYTLVADTDPTVGGASKVLVTKRPLYVLRRLVYYFDDSQGEYVTKSADLCHYVLSFNIEYFDRGGGVGAKRFRQISDLGTPRDDFAWPIGDDPKEILHSAIRVTLRVVASATERQERMITRVIWVPMAQ